MNKPYEPKKPKPDPVRTRKLLLRERIQHCALAATVDELERALVILQPALERRLLELLPELKDLK